MNEDETKRGMFLSRVDSPKAKTVDAQPREPEPAIEARPERKRLEQQPRHARHHDVLVVPPAGVVPEGAFFRVPVIKDASDEACGRYEDTPELWTEADYGNRKVDSAARPFEHGADDAKVLRRGPAFSTLPIKPEPASTSCAACYLVNAENLNYESLWTEALWSSPSSDEQPGRSAPVHPDHFEVLLAGPRGKVLRLRAENLDAWSASAGTFEVRDANGVRLAELQAVELKNETEIWSQLRNGTIAGRALLNEEKRVVPLVNVTSLQDLS